ncbi:S41 family peptidase [Salinimicrobium sp. GXAS 041]|uniref:S41 family peptidase n=1 Tax=Salinimicrobium sp. GXAS 041 TaxID=3400806 RepID=UPI003C755483
MKSIRIIILSFLFGNLFFSCSQDMDDVVDNASTLEVNQFIWKGLNNIYLYKYDVPQLQDDYFGSNQELNDYLRSFNSPEDLFDALLAPQDRFSFLVDDYIELENALEGIALTNGMEYGLVRISNNSSLVLGYVRYVLPNTSASKNGIQRGDLFHTVNGQQLTTENYRQLLAEPQYTIGFAHLEDTNIISTGQSVSLVKEQYTENPIFFADVLETGQGNVGYLMYNSFSSSFDDELNAVFARYKAEGVTNLILDLRYNGGGSVESATDLASMITGQFTGEVFSTEQWNEDYQTYFEENNPSELINRFDNKIRTGESINNLFLSNVYIITSLRTASASELVINGLMPYIDVVQVGDTTTGKFQASVTLYDSPDFGRRGANPSHTYAIQPLIYKSANAAGVTDFLEGLAPDVVIIEDITNLGTIGDLNEPLLQASLQHIKGEPFKVKRKGNIFEIVGESGMDSPLYKNMYETANYLEIE